MDEKTLQCAVRIYEQPEEGQTGFTLYYHLVCSETRNGCSTFGVEVVKQWYSVGKDQLCDCCFYGGITENRQEMEQIICRLADGKVTPYALDETLDYILGENLMVADSW